MLNGVPRLVAAASLTVLMLLGVWVAPAQADPAGPVNCGASPVSPACRIKVTKQGRHPRGQGETGNESETGSDGTADSGGEDSTCAWRKASDDPPPPGVSGPGGWYSKVCSGDGWGLGTRPEWVPDEAVAAADPAVVAHSAVATLRLPKPTLSFSPAPPAPQFVNLPTWLWLDRNSWDPRSATASVPGLAVTATATPVRVLWSTGDGAQVTCAGSGTRWRPGMDPAAPSPTCGHTYRQPSVGRFGGVFAVRATVTWQVSWAGGGQSGTVPALSTTSTAQIVVREATAVNSGVLR